MCKFASEAFSFPQFLSNFKGENGKTPEFRTCTKKQLQRIFQRNTLIRYWIIFMGKQITSVLFVGPLMAFTFSTTRCLRYFKILSKFVLIFLKSAVTERCWKHYEEIYEKWSTLAAFGNLSMFTVLVAFENLLSLH